jgi:hypothetical protein
MGFVGEINKVGDIPFNCGTSSMFDPISDFTSKYDISSEAPEGDKDD